MKEQQNVIECYNATARQYAEKFIRELDHKPFDTALLTEFYAAAQAHEPLIDIGCGPGQVARFLFDLGLKQVTGVDIAPHMIEVARELHPGIRFEAADMLNFGYAANSFGAATAFYAIIHFDYPQLEKAFSEIYRILKPGGQFLFSFHIGEEVVRVENFLGQPVSMEAHFLDPSKIKAIVTAFGFEPVRLLERPPYKEVEYQSRRAYFWVKKAVS